MQNLGFVRKDLGLARKRRGFICTKINTALKVNTAGSLSSDTPYIGHSTYHISSARWAPQGI